MKHKLPLVSPELIDAITECVSLLESAIEFEQREVSATTNSTPDLLQLSDRPVSSDWASEEPVRTIHHFACTGGTLITKCLASMPNTQVLSEVEPYSEMTSKEKFAPTNILQLLRSGSRVSSIELEAQVFLGGLAAIYDDCQHKGLRFVLRDHAHSKYCFGEHVSKAPSLLEVLKKRYQVRSIVTVRHPLDSYLSARKNNWLTFPLDSLDVYSERYIRFLSDYKTYSLFKYEDLLENPCSFMQRICEALDLAYFEGFEQVFGVYQLSGDSGRFSDKIEVRARREVSDDLLLQLESAPHYETLCSMLDYEL